MKKALAGLAVGGLLTLGAGSMSVAHAATNQQGQVLTQNDSTNSDDDDGGKWGLFGLLGLAGLAGLAGLKRRDRYDERSRYTTGTGTRTGTSTSANP
jgi:MYXO-CTERM domain-containing protein